MAITLITPDEDTASPVEVLHLSSPPPALPNLESIAITQDIVFLPPSHEKLKERERVEQAVLITFEFAEFRPRLQMQHTVRHVYQLYGNDGLESLQAALDGDYDEYWQRRRDAPALRQASADLDADARALLEDIYNKERDAFLKCLKPLGEKIERSAELVASKALRRSRQSLLREANQYLVFNSNDAGTLFAALASGIAKLPFRGTAVLGLARALLIVDKANKKTKEATRKLDSIIDDEAQKHFDRIRKEHFLGDVQDQRHFRQVIAPQMVAARPRVKQQRQIRKQALAEMIQLIALLGTRYPVLFRIWDQPDYLDDIRRILNTGLGADGRKQEAEQIQQLSRLRGFRDDVIEVLRETWEGITNTEKRIARHDLDPWRYPPLIDKTLAAMGCPQSTVEWQFIREHLKERLTDISWLTILSMAGGVAEIGVAVAAVSGPVLIATVAISTVIGALDWITDAWNAGIDEDVYNSTLDPSRNIAFEPSFAGVYIGLAFQLLQVRGFAKILSKAG